MHKNEKSPPELAMSDASLDAHIDAAPALVGLTIDHAYREGVKLHMRATANAARFVLQSPLEDEAEPAPVFRA
jgi:hypothetical protein